MIPLLLLALAMPLAAQAVDDLDNEDMNEEIVQVNYNKKSVVTAMLLSTLFPGAGQFYANYRSVTTYIFPVIEIGLWVGYFSYQKKGSDKEDEYEAFATDVRYDEEGIAYTNYNRQYQQEVENLMIGVNAEDLYDDTHFRLDDSNSQHFYEDIGKYDKYIFGWEDWYATYVIHNGGNALFAFQGEDADQKWVGNYADSTHMAAGIYDEPGCALRDEYITMRQDAEEYYDSADMFTFFIVFNHILSAIDAVRVTRAYNVNYISKLPPVEVDVKTCMRGDELTPMLCFTHRF